MQRSDPESVRLFPLGIELHCAKCCRRLTHCATTGSDADGELHCEVCGQRFAVRDGVPLFDCATEDPGPASHTVVREAVDRFEQLLADSGGAVETALRQWTRWLGLSARDARMMMGSAAAGWRFVAPPLDEGTCVLQVGCGWGAIAASLARDAGGVVAVDSDADRLRFARRWIEGLDLRPTGFVCLRGAEHLPFADAQFDWVVLNGAIGLPVLQGSDAGPKQRDAGEMLLSEACRVLRRGGTLLVVDDNRRRCFGTRAPSEPALTTKEMKERTGASDNPTRRGATWGQYVRWLDHAGLGARQAFFVLPDRHVPGALWRRETSKATIAASFQRACTSRRQRWRHWARGWRHALCPPALLFRASREAPLPPSVIELAVKAVAAAVADQKPAEGALELLSYRINCDMGMVTAVFRSRNEKHDLPGCVLRLPLESRAREHARIEVERLRTAQTDERWKSLAARLPRVLHEGHVGSVYFSAVGLLPGSSIERLPCNDARWRRALAEAAAFGTALHRQTCGNHGTAQAIVERVNDEVARLRDLAYTSAQRAALDRLGNVVREGLERLRLPSVTGHGDFKLQNCLFDPGDMRLTGVIDWGASQAIELPLYDLAFLYVDYLALRYGRHVAAVLGQWLAGQDCGGLTTWLAARAEDVGLEWSDKLNELLAHYQWLERMAPLTTGNEMARFDAGYVDGMFDALPRD